MPSTNYYKATLGDLSAHTMQQALFPFADSDPEQARAALMQARARFVGAPADEVSVSVWKRTAVVPGYIPEVGAVVKGKTAGGEKQDTSGEE